jgi:hypothetical protein
MAADAGLGEIDLDKATVSGYLQTVSVGQTQAVDKPTQPVRPTTSIAITLTTPTSGPAATTTPLPTEIEEADLGAVPATSADSSPTSPDFASPNHFLNGALIPVAAIVTGIG